MVFNHIFKLPSQQHPDSSLIEWLEPLVQSIHLKKIKKKHCITIQFVFKSTQFQVLELCFSVSKKGVSCWTLAFLSHPTSVISTCKTYWEMFNLLSISINTSLVQHIIITLLNYFCAFEMVYKLPQILLYSAASVIFFHWFLYFGLRTSKNVPFHLKLDLWLTAATLILPKSKRSEQYSVTDISLLHVNHYLMLLYIYFFFWHFTYRVANFMSLKSKI